MDNYATYLVCNEAIFWFQCAVWVLIFLAVMQFVRAYLYIDERKMTERLSESIVSHIERRIQVLERLHKEDLAQRQKRFNDDGSKP